MFNEKKPAEVDKRKSISQLTMDELSQLKMRLYMEREVQHILFDLKRNSGERFDYDNRPIVDATTPVDQLYHHGILGMKWGVRKSPERLAKKETKQLDKANKDFSSSKNISQTLKKAQQNLDGNTKYQKEAEKVLSKLVKDTGLQGEALNNAYQSKMLDVIDKYLQQDKSTYSPKGDMRVSMALVDIQGNNYLTPILLKLDGVEHSEDEHVYGLYLVNNKGQIKLFDDESFSHYQKDDFLMHFGVLGMKWGVRKDSGGSGKRSGKGHSDYEDSLSLRKKSINEMSNAELRKVTERMQLEKNYSRITSEEKSYGKRYVENFAYAAAPVAIATATSKTLKTLTPVLASKGFSEKQLSDISTAIPKIGAAISFAMTVANDTRSNRTTNPVQVKNR
ncbi:MAG: DUF7211 domain-containing protein [Brevinema sp.]